MRAPAVRGLRLRFGASALNHRLLGVLGPRLPRLTGGWMPWLQLARFAPRTLPGPDWVRVRPILSGVCGTDLTLLTGRASAAPSPFSSFPAVLGHEVVGEVSEVGSGVGSVGVGRRVVVDPVISCFVRGLEPCRWCRDGVGAHCLRSTDGTLAAGLLVGYCRDLPGAWGDEMLVHVSQVHPVPSAVSDEEAVLVEPLSVALHAVLQRAPEPGGRALVIGGGTLGQLVIAALRLQHHDAGVTVIARHPFQAALAGRMGADAVIGRDGGEGRAARTVGATAHRPLVGRPVYTSGFDVVYDCVGSRATLDQAIRLAGPRATLVLVGGPGVIGPLDLTLTWLRELRLTGSYAYGRETRVEGTPHTFELALRLLDGDHALPLADLITHRVPLERWREGIHAALRRGRAGALKVVFTRGT